MDEELPLVVALSPGNESIIRLLLVSYDAPMLLFFDRTPHLLLACYNGNPSHCEILLKSSNMDPNWVSSITKGDTNAASILGRGQTPLHIASRYNHIDVLRLLIQHGAIANVQDGDGNTPLHYVTSVESARILLQEGHRTNSNIPNQQEQVPLHVTTARGRVDIADLFVSHGATQDVTDDQYLSPFLTAALHGHASMLVFLLRQAKMARENDTGAGAHTEKLDAETETFADGDRESFRN